MTPDELVAALEGRMRLSGHPGEIAAAGARRRLEGFRVRGHRISMRGSRIWVTGPQAFAVAREVRRRAAAGMAAALRGAVQ